MGSLLCIHLRKDLYMENNEFYITSFKRFIINAIDILLVVIVLTLIFGESESIRVLVIELIFLFAYFIVMGHYLGYTLAQKLFKVKMIDSESEKLPTIKQMALRELIALTYWTGIGFLIASFTYSYNSGFYWDRWTNIKVIPAKLKLAEFNKKLDDDRRILFPDSD